MLTISSYGKELKHSILTMEFIKIAYCLSIPLLLLLTLSGRKPVIRLSFNLLAVSNLLLVGNSFFLAKQLVAGYQIARSYSLDPLSFFHGNDGLLVKYLLVLCLPFFSLSRHIRSNRLFSFLVLLLVYIVFPYPSWNLYGLLFKIMAYLCGVCTCYALLWLMNKLPFQSPAV